MTTSESKGIVATKFAFMEHIDTIIPHFPSKDISKIIIDYAYVIPLQFDLNQSNVLPFTHYDSDKGYVVENQTYIRNFLNEHLVITKTKLTCKKLSHPWIVMSIGPNLFVDFKLYIRTSAEARVYLVKKRTPFSSFLTFFSSEGSPQAHSTHLSFFFKNDLFVCVRVIREKSEIILAKLDNGVVSVNSLEVETESLSEYSILVGCGYENQTVEILEDYYVSDQIISSCTKRTSI
jgi:hypothetical protein